MRKSIQRRYGKMEGMFGCFCLLFCGTIMAYVVMDAYEQWKFQQKIKRERERMERDD